jgi:hypothetical protein
VPDPPLVSEPGEPDGEASSPSAAIRHARSSVFTPSARGRNVLTGAACLRASACSPAAAPARTSARSRSSRSGGGVTAGAAIWTSAVSVAFSSSAVPTGAEAATVVTAVTTAPCAARAARTDGSSAPDSSTSRSALLSQYPRRVPSRSARTAGRGRSAPTWSPSCRPRRHHRRTEGAARPFRSD